MSKRKVQSKRKERIIEINETKVRLIVGFLYDTGTNAAMVMASYLESKLKEK